MKKKSTLVLLALFCTLLWGSAFPSIKIGYQLFHIDSSQTGQQLLFAGIRFSLAGAMTFISAGLFRLLRGSKSQEEKNPAGNEREGAVEKSGSRTVKYIKAILILALVQTFLTYFFYYIGMAHVSGVKGAILNGSSAFVCAIIACLYYREPMNRWKWFGCVIGMAGVVIVNLGSGSLGKGFSFFGEGFMLLSVVVLSIGALLSKELSRGLNPVIICAGYLLVGGLALACVGFLMGASGIPLFSSGAKGMLLMLYMAFISAAAFSVWTWLLKNYPMGQVTIYQFLNPVFGTILSAIILGDNLFNVYTITALILVCGSIFLVNHN